MEIRRLHAAVKLQTFVRLHYAVQRVQTLRAIAAAALQKQKVLFIPFSHFYFLLSQWLSRSYQMKMTKT